MQRIVLPYLAAISLLGAATRPRYGGALRVEMQAAVRSLDPSQPPAGAAKAKLAALVFDRLVRLDENGIPKSSLALSWKHDAERKRWEFRLRSGVTLHDGSTLTPAMVAAALSSGSEAWQVSATADSVVIRSARPMPGLLAELANVRHSVVLRGGDGSLLGTGPFAATEWAPGRHAVFTAHEQYWGGRPFLDSVVVEMARTPREQSLDLELGRADLVEIPADRIRRAAEGEMEVWTSAPVELVALVLESSGQAAMDPRLGEAISLSIDRAAIHNVLLQKQGEPAGGLLPQWLSGYAFLFNTARDTGRARQLVSSLSPKARSLPLFYDAADALAQAVAQRVAVDAREAGITLRVSTPPAAAEAGAAGLRLSRLRIGWTDPERALDDLASSLGLSGGLRLSASAPLEEIYAAERSLVDGFRVIPLFHLPEIYGVNPRVKTWNTRGLLKTGGWRLDDLWLEQERP